MARVNALFTEDLGKRAYVVTNTKREHAECRNSNVPVALTSSFLADRLQSNAEAAMRLYDRRVAAVVICDVSGTVIRQLFANRRENI
jgi:hypothetical protein